MWGEGKSTTTCENFYKSLTWLCSWRRKVSRMDFVNPKLMCCNPLKIILSGAIFFNMYGVSSLHYWESIFPLFTCNSSHRHSLKVFHFFLSTSLGHVPILYAVLLCRMYSSFHLNQSFKLKKATNLILSAVIASSFSDNLQAKCIHLQGFRPTAHLD